ncbi:hippocampus abundant transcript-like protein 2 [Myotis myotis]|uniref:hippocampus abundant transcript-like protein 2 n=1 Tax=Myotis myotis TaxID=51298 RepID=UPI00174D559E|nr:hippocampus abundant transcript-like protein 2 [Myotis myotis]
MAEERAGARAAGGCGQEGFGRPRVYHAAIVIFLEFFAWGLLTTPMLTREERGAALLARLAKGCAFVAVSTGEHCWLVRTHF